MINKKLELKTAEEILQPYVETPFRHTKIVDKDNALKAMKLFGEQFDKTKGPLVKTDISIHFTIKGQTIAEINEKLDKYITENQGTLPFDFSESTTPRSILHHCFLPEKLVIEKGFSTEIYDDILHSISEHKVCWYGTSDYGLVWDRRYMLENLAKLNGLAVFIGEIKEGVQEELEIAKELGIDVLLIE